MNFFIKSLKFTVPFRVYKKGDVVNFRPGVNLLVGDQGSGKSSLLYELRDHTQKEAKNSRLDLVDPGVRCSSYFLDFEKDNVRVKAYIGDNAGFQLASKFMSHGETVNCLVGHLEESNQAVIICDEPDTALSGRSIIKLANLFKKAANNNQIIVSGHNPWLIESFEEVLCLEGGVNWVKSEDFLASMRKK